MTNDGGGDAARRWAHIQGKGPLRRPVVGLTLGILLSPEGDTGETVLPSSPLMGGT